MSEDLQLGVTSLSREVVGQRLKVTGEIPTWLKGTLIRNGAAKFEVGSQKLRHWFDGLAMLHNFSFVNGTVTYTNRFLKGRAYRQARKIKELYYPEFATNPDSYCRSIWLKISQQFTDNASVNVIRLGQSSFVAMTETPYRVKFNPYSLETVGILKYNDEITGHLTTVHPHFDFNSQEFFNYITHFSWHSSYNIYRLKYGTRTRRLICSIPVKKPAYMHSFGMTENYIILSEFPLVVDVASLVLKNRPFKENLQWQANRATRFLLINKHNGRLAGVYQCAPFFAFHHINAFEKGGEVVLDIVAYPDAGIIDHLYLHKFKQGNINMPTPELRRYRLPLGGGDACHENLFKDFVEFPRINYPVCNTKDYQYIYGVGAHSDDGFTNQLLKVDIKRQQARVWVENNCFPGEPVFVAAPKAIAEDDGVVLSLGLNVETEKSFLLILDAGSFRELARAEIPHPIPFGSHGQYYEELNDLIISEKNNF